MNQSTRENMCETMGFIQIHQDGGARKTTVPPGTKRQKEECDSRIRECTTLMCFVLLQVINRISLSQSFDIYRI